MQEDQQEDAQSSSRGHDHRRPKSAGNLSEQAGMANGAHKSGRPPLAETTANNKIGLKVRPVQKQHVMILFCVKCKN